MTEKKREKGVDLTNAGPYTANVPKSARNPKGEAIPQG
jgi:hypothetical protein